MFARIARVVGNLFTVVDDSQPSNRVRLACEGLEDRCTPATFTVNTPDDFSDANRGDGEAGVIVIENRTKILLTSLRSAIEEGNTLAANGEGNDYTINFDMSKLTTGMVPLMHELPALDADYTIDGPGATALAVARLGETAERFRIFFVPENRSSTINNLTITGGDTDGFGGGALSRGNLTLEGCLVYDNTADGFGGGISSLRAFGNNERLACGQQVTSLGSRPSEGVRS